MRLLILPSSGIAHCPQTSFIIYNLYRRLNYYLLAIMDAAPLTRYIAPAHQQENTPWL